MAEEGGLLGGLSTADERPQQGAEGCHRGVTVVVRPSPLEKDEA
jgi:hypothetical protein